MIIVKVWGGIGNQLFQYVFGQYLQYRYKQEIYYDENSFVSVDKLRQRELEGIESNVKIYNNCSFSKVRGVKNRILRFIFQINPANHYIEEGKSIPIRFHYNHRYFFQGYWQDVKYYKWLKENVSGFTIASSNYPIELATLRNQILSAPNSVSIHVRRGDYFLSKNIKKYGVCDTQYFEDALGVVASRYKDFTLFVFSDDLEWVKNNMKLPNDTIFVPNYDVSQFAYIELMSLCQHHIISNSSFSWWGAVLNKNTDTLVISPQKWTLDSCETIALESWLKI